MRAYILIAPLTVFLGLAALSLTAYPSTSVAAKDKAAQKTEAAAAKDAWLTRCEKVKLDEKKPEQQYCEMFQSLSIVQKDKDGKARNAQRLTEFAIGYPPDQKKARGVLIVPLGTLVEESMSMEIDGKSDVTFRVRYCTPQGCFAFLTMPDSILERMAKGNKLTVRAKAYTGQNLEIVISLAGFAKAHEKIKPQS